MVIVVTLVLSAVVVYSFMPEINEYRTRRRIFAMSKRTAPSSLKLEFLGSSYVQTAVTNEGLQVGVARFRDGSFAKFWFLSHHLSGDRGGTLFEMSDGTKRYMVGCFCCEVQLPDAQPSSLDDLNKFIDENDGSYP